MAIVREMSSHYSCVECNQFRTVEGRASKLLVCALALLLEGFGYDNFSARSD